MDFTKIHLHVRKRKKANYITTITGVDIDKELFKDLKKKLCCNGTKKGELYELSGDQRHAIAEYFVDNKLISANDIVIHGF